MTLGFNDTRGLAADFSYEVVRGWPQLAADPPLGQVTGVDVDSRGRVFVFHRAGREWTDSFPADPIAAPAIVVFDGATGERLASWGEGRFVMPHSLTVDREDNVWLTDVGLHQVLKLTPDGRLLLAIGTAGVPGDGSRHFALPTDVAVEPDGGFYVSDGYGNARVARFSADGRFLGEFGARGAGPGQFDLPHGIALDGVGRVYVADRGNSRLQVFDAGGRFVAEWKSDALGRPFGVAIGGDGKVYVADGGDQPVTPPDHSRALRLAADGAVEASFGSFGDGEGQFRMAHAIAVGPDGAVYVADALGMRVQKFLSRSRATAITREPAGADSQESLSRSRATAITREGGAEKRRRDGIVSAARTAP
jgi:peptidylamidoglycolate lyase